MTRVERSGLSLIEVLVLIAIIGIVLGLTLPAVRRVREPAARSVCMNNLKQIMVGLHNYEETAGRVPYAPGFPTGCIGPGSNPEERLSWMVAILPYVEQDAVWRQFAVEKGLAANEPAAQTFIKTFRCPSGNPASNEAFTSYVAMAGLGDDAARRRAGATGNGFMGYGRVTDMEMITDGTANTIALVERLNAGPWARGGTSTLRGFSPSESIDSQFGSGHKEVFQAAMADGSVRSIRKALGPAKLSSAITIAGNEPFSDWE